MKMIALSLWCFLALNVAVNSQNVVGAFQDIVVALKKVGFLSFFTHPEIILNYNNSQGPAAFLYRQLLTQIPEFVSNTLRDCLDTEIDAITPIADQQAKMPYLDLDDDEKVVLYTGSFPKSGDGGVGCPGITTLFPADSCLGKPTVSTNPDAYAKKTSLIFIGPKKQEYVVRYDDFVLVDDTRHRILNRTFKADRKTVILVHGWTDHYYRDGWIWSLKEFLLIAKAKPNILIIDWRQWSQSLAITKVKMNTGLVAKQLATVLYMMTNDPWAHGGPKLDARKISIYGHSYGGPIAGYAGKLFSIRFTGSSQILPEILALDPSDQCFGRGAFGIYDQDSLDYNINTYLDSNAAQSVKVIHSDSNAFGAYQRVGTADIYLNQGSGQPDCALDLSGLANADVLFTLACSHYRATRIMTQAYYNQTNGNCQPVAFRCGSFDDFLSGVCTCLLTDRRESYSLLAGAQGRCRELAANPYEMSPSGEYPADLLGHDHNFHYDTRDDRESWYLIMGSEPPYCLSTFVYSLRSTEIPNNVHAFFTLGNNKITIDASSRRQGIFTIPAAEVKIYDQVKLSYTDEPGSLLGTQRQFDFQSVSFFYTSHLDYCVKSNYSRIYCAYTNDFIDEDHPQRDIISTRKSVLPGGFDSIEVIFTTARCLSILKICRDEVYPKALSGSPRCVSFVKNLVNNYIVAFYDQFCGFSDQLCAGFMECLFALRSSYGPDYLVQRALNYTLDPSHRDFLFELIGYSNFFPCNNLLNIVAALREICQPQFFGA